MYGGGNRGPFETAQAARTPTIQQPSRFDVLLGRGKGNQQHPGNRRYQVLVGLHQDRYFAAVSRHDKVRIAQLVVFAVKETGRFLKYDNDLQGWLEVDDLKARHKVCQALQYRRRNGATGAAAVVSTNSRSAATTDVPDTDSEPTHPDGTHSLDPDQRSESLPSVAAAVADTNLEPQGVARLPPVEDPNEMEHPNAAAISEHDSDFQSVLRTLSRGTHQGDTKDDDR